MGENRYARSVLVGKPAGNLPLGNPKRSRKDIQRFLKKYYGRA
jgi:hypothetical protein